MLERVRHSVLPMMKRNGPIVAWIVDDTAEIGAEFLFQVIAERAERATLIVTTNLPFSEWTQVFPNPRLCKALLDRITDRAHIIETGTESYRFRRTVEGRQKTKAS